MTSALRIEGLSVVAHSGGSERLLVDNLSLRLEPGEIFGLIGESGSGKTTAVRAILGLLDRNSVIAQGEMWVGDRHIFGEDLNEFRSIRGRRVGMVNQDPSGSFNPLERVGKQILEVLRRHRPDLTRKEQRDRMTSVLLRMGFNDAERVLRSYPHQLSGGMQQRAAIALAVVTEPDVLIADECTTALDVTTQAEVIGLLRTLTENGESAIIFVSHDLLLAADVCNTIAVMYGGQIVEVGPVENVLTKPDHPYTKALLNAVPTWEGSGKFLSIPGRPPVVRMGDCGCRFAPRCSKAEQLCRTQDVPLYPRLDVGEFRCFYPEHSEVAFDGEFIAKDV